MDWNNYQQVLAYFNENSNPIGIVGDAFKYLFPAHVPAKPSALYGRIGKVVKLLSPSKSAYLSDVERSKGIKDAARTVLFALYGISLINPAPADPLDYLYKYIENKIAPLSQRETANNDLAKLIQQDA